MQGALTETSFGEFSVLYANPPSSGDAVPIGVMLLDPAAGKLHLRLRQDWDTFIRDEDTWYFEQLEEAVGDMERELGAKAAMELMLQGSNAVTGDEPQKTMVASYPGALNRLYSTWVKTPVRRFETHLPLYSLRSAAGKFLENEEVYPEGWIEIPGGSGARLTQGQFIARIQGTSMEPVVPNGSLAVFDSEARGTRVGRFVLVEERRRGGASAYTLKKYTSVKQDYSEDSTERVAIQLLPINSEHDEIDLDPEDDRYHIIGFFVRILDPDLAEGLVDDV